MAEKERNGFFDFLIGYENPTSADGAKGSLGKRFYAKKLSGRVTQETKRFLDSGFMKFLRGTVETFRYASAKTYGILLLTFGILSLIIQFLKDYFGIFGGSSLSALIIAACFGIVSIPLLLVDAPLSIMMQNFRPTEIIFFEFFCIKRLYKTGNERTLHPAFAVLIGAFLALLGAYIPLYTIALGIGILLFVVLTFLSPEFCFLSTLLFLPYFSLLPYSSEIIAVIAFLGTLSFIRKTAFGKRVIFFEQYDILILVMVFGMLISGIFSGGERSFGGGVIMAAMLLGYFLAGNTVTNRRLADCAVNAVAISSVPASLVSIVTFLIDVSCGEWSDFVFNGISSTFTETGSAAAFFIVGFLFSVVLAKEAHGFTENLYSIFAILNLFAMLLTGEFFAIGAILFAAVAYLALKAGGWLALLLPLLFGLSYLIFFIPEAFLSSLPDVFYSDGSFAVMRRALSVFLDNMLLGIGMGTDNFISEMSSHGVLGRSDCGNIFLELGLEAGIFALVAFLLLLIVRIIHRAVYQRYIKHSQVGKLSPLVSVTIFALFVFGSFEYLFRDLSMLYLVFSVFGLSGATLRVAKQEHDDSVLYFEDEKSSTSSVVNILLK